MTKILLAVDGGPAGDAATRWLATRADLPGTDIRVVCVSRDRTDAGAPARAAVDRAAVRLLGAAPGVAVAADVVEGDVFATLLRLGAAADLLVVGSDRPRRAEALLHSTLPMRLCGVAPCDLVVVPADWEPAAADAAVVVGWDDDDASFDALDAAAREAQASARPLRIVYVWSPVPTSAFDPEGGAALSEMIEAQEARLLEGAYVEARSAYATLEISTELHRGSVPGGLLRSDRTALVVVGSHHHTVVGELAFGSTGDALIRADHRFPIWVTPPRRRPTARTPAAGTG